MVWYSIPKRRYHIKISECVKRAPYNFILQHPRFLQSPIANYCIKLFIDGQVELQLFPKLLLQVLAREQHNSMVIPPEEG